MLVIMVTGLHLSDEDRLQRIIKTLTAEFLIEAQLQFSNFSDGQTIDASQPRPWFKEMEENIPRYGGIRKDGSSIDFLLLYYKPYIDNGRLTQNHLNRIDPKLFNALKFETRKGEVKLSDLIPSSHLK